MSLIWCHWLPTCCTATRSWNAQATQQSQLTEQKRVALLALLNFPEEAQQILLKHASEFGSATAFSEQAFANKALMVGYMPRNVSKDWARRLTVTEKSLILTLGCL